MNVASTLAAFQCIAENGSLCETGHTFLLAVPYSEREVPEWRVVDAMNVAMPLALQHPRRDIAIVCYRGDAESLYAALGKIGSDLATLHCCSISKERDEIAMEGVHNFDFAFAFRTKAGMRQSFISADSKAGFCNIDLTKKIGRHGAPYLSGEGKILFPANDPSLQKYADMHAGAVLARPERFITTTAPGLRIEQP